MTIEKSRKVFRIAIKIIIALGIIGGLLCGVIFMEPSLNALQYPTIYGNQRAWGLASTVAMFSVWLCNTALALFLYSQIALMEMLYKILRIKEKESKTENKS